MGDVELLPFIISQILGVVILAIVAIAFQIKRKFLTLSLISLSTILALVMHSLLANWVVVALVIISLCRLVTYAWLEYMGKRISQGISFAIMIFFVILNVPAIVIIDTLVGVGVVDWFVMAASMFLSYGQWEKGPHMIRISNITLSIMLIINSIFFFNFMAIAIEVFVLGSIVVFYFRWFFKGERGEGQNRTTGSSDEVIELCTQ
ncbi:MAG: hypothetical protein FWE16_01810 [Firmicutes bacterium]|nr:hypothetical protein [Bacillota bacterium]